VTEAQPEKAVAQRPKEEDALRYFGIRHHGPGCARSLTRALAQWQPDCLLIEGPPEADALIPHVADEAMRPPVALLVYCPDEPQRAAFYPFAVFSPEWQALQWAVRHAVPVRFIDLPRAHALALDKAHEAAKAAAPAAADAGADDEEPPPAAAEVDNPPPQERPADPLDWLAQAAGYGDGESWWNHMVEERGDGTDLFAAIAEAMAEVRKDWPPPADERGERESQREAHMRQCIRAARKEGFARIAVVCGAWHVSALQPAVSSVKADAALLKGLPKLKIDATWVPWTHRHLALASGYGAGVQAPGWYGFLWSHDAAVAPRSVAWLARVARLLRQSDLDCSSAHVIEAARLADTLAALRERPAPGLDELTEAARTVMLTGDEAPLALIRRELMVGDELGSVPPAVPTVPLQRDLERAQKALRLKPEALERPLDLDLRNDNDLARSHLLHRLRVLDIRWGELAQAGRAARGSFHEVWRLRWQPEFAVGLIQASRHGGTVLQAATTRVLERAAQATGIDELSTLVDQALLADLGDAVPGAIAALEARAAVTGDALQLLRALPALGNVYRYGSVRRTDTQAVTHVLDRLIVRAAIGLPLACASLDADAAQALREPLLAAHAAVALRGADEQTAAWRQALRQLAQAQTSAALLRGLGCRLLLDEGVWPASEVAPQLSRNLSRGVEPLDAASWLEGFLNRNAMVLLHDAALWALVDDWLSGLAEDAFTSVLPLVRRTFAEFSASERRSLGERAQAPVGGPGPAAAAVVTWNAERAALAVPLLRELLGFPQ
jgi:hypothetical protein